MKESFINATGPIFALSSLIRAFQGAYLRVLNECHSILLCETKGQPHSFYCYLFFNKLLLLLVSISRSAHCKNVSWLRIFSIFFASSIHFFMKSVAMFTDILLRNRAPTASSWPELLGRGASKKSNNCYNKKNGIDLFNMTKRRKKQQADFRQVTNKRWGLFSYLDILRAVVFEQLHNK